MSKLKALRTLSIENGLVQIGGTFTVKDKVEADELVKAGVAEHVGGGEEEGEASAKPSDPRNRQTKPAKDAPETK